MSSAPALPPRKTDHPAAVPAPPAMPFRPAAQAPVAPAAGSSTSATTTAVDHPAVAGNKKSTFANVAALTHRVTNSLSTTALANAKTAQDKLPTVRQVMEYHPLRLAYKTLAPYVSNKDNQLGEDTPEARRRNLERVQFVSTWLDARYKIPFTNYKVGIDPIISAVPVVGDVISTTMSCYVVYLARRFHVPWHITARMLFNVLLNASFGAVPFVGSAWDVAYKSNLRNLILLEEFLKKEAVAMGQDPRLIDKALKKSRQDLFPDQVIPDHLPPASASDDENNSNSDTDADGKPVWPEVANAGTVPLTR
ncbi:hypothetical protein HDU86_005439 [Geranomyces michiganensis]|nr:hypothetical protein HDU86_005439 [Geranomyces michiganensis]